MTTTCGLDPELTYVCEGGGLPIVLRPHWPGGCSGVTIGPGYDMGLRTAAEVRVDLQAAGIPLGLVFQLSAGARLRGEAAGTWAREHRYLAITPAQSRALFARVYPEYVARARAYCAGFGGRLEAFPARLQEVLVDLAYRGDLEPAYGRAKLGRAVATGDAKALSEALADVAYWQRECNLKPMKNGEPNSRHVERAAWATRTT